MMIGLVAIVLLAFAASVTATLVGSLHATSSAASALPAGGALSAASEGPDR